MKNWEDLVLETAERFGGTFPHPETSQAIATVHQRAPNSVERAIDEVIQPPALPACVLRGQRAG